MSKWIMVNSHRRSGTHFLIDSLRFNINDASFPNHRNIPKDFNIGSLYRKEEKVYDTFRKLLEQSGTVIIKSHLLPEEMDIKNPKDKYEELIKEIYSNSSKINIFRDGKDVLVSLYNLLYPNRSIDFTTFLRQQNDHIPIIREVMEYDKDRVEYWAYHLEAWNNELNSKVISFEDLKSNYNEIMQNLIRELNLEGKKEILKPQIPKNKFFHNVQIKLYNFGLFNNIEATSIKPRNGKIGGYQEYFNNEDLDFYYSKIKKIEKI